MTKGMRSWSPYVRSVELYDPEAVDWARYPFSLDIVKALRTPVQFEEQVTMLVGENGSGKSTLLEGIAVAIGLNAEGGSRNFSFSTARTESNLHEHLKILRGLSRPRDTYFLRAETFYNVASEIDRLDNDPGPGAYIAPSYGVQSLHAVSHGESFIALVGNRLMGDGLYILDEPEAALSPTGQITFLAHLRKLVRSGSQFIIATHSPIILGYPGAAIYQLEGDRLEPRAYEETLHYQLTLKLLKHPDYLKHLIDGVLP